MNKFILASAMILAACSSPDTTMCRTQEAPEGLRVECPDGGVFFVEAKDGQDGQDGATGATGATGQPGQDGQDGQDGAQGPAGQDGQDGQDSFIVGAVDPCGDGPGPDEILFTLADGRYAAWYFNLGLVILGNGSYVTTDAQACPFTISGASDVLTF